MEILQPLGWLGEDRERVSFVVGREEEIYRQGKRGERERENDRIISG